MSKHLFAFLIALFMAACANPKGEQKQTKRATREERLFSEPKKLEPPASIIEEQDTLAKEKSYPLPLKVTQFLQLNLQADLAQNKLLIAKDSMFESSYVEGDSVQWRFYRYGKSEIIMLGDSSLLSLSLKDQELLDNFFIQIGMSYAAFKQVFSDLDSAKQVVFHEPNLLEQEGSGHIWFREGDMDEPVGWTMGFLNDSLYYLNYTVYFEF